MVFLLMTLAGPNRSPWRGALIVGSIAVGWSCSDLFTRRGSTPFG